jgi:Protein of unknown function (DUF1570)
LLVSSREQLPIMRFCGSVLVGLALLANAVHAFARGEDLRLQYEQLSRQFAAANAGWRPESPTTGSLLFIAPDEYSPAPTEKRTLGAARQQYADQLFGLAKAAANAGQISLAFQWTTEAVRENPNHAEARRVLGYVERDGEWLTPYGARMHDAGKVWNWKRGWVPVNDVGSRKTNSAADAAQHSDIRHGWAIRTDHFLVRTNHSLAAGAELAARLERLYQIWRQLFAGFFYSDEEVRGLFAGERIARVPARQFKVFYHRDRDDYVNTLSHRQPMIGETLGIYFDTNAEAHFFAPDSNSSGDPNAKSASAGLAIATLNHEAVHQLFQESKPAARHIGARANFWVIEGVATYFETLTEHLDPQAGRYFTIGELDKGRLPTARRSLKEGQYTPLAELTRMGKDDLQHSPNIRQQYAESCGLAAFFINAQHGRYREALVRYLQAVYSGRDTEQTLAELTGAGYADLDAAYRRYMESLP